VSRPHIEEFAPQMAKFFARATPQQIVVAISGWTMLAEDPSTTTTPANQMLTAMMQRVLEILDERDDVDVAAAQAEMAGPIAESIAEASGASLKTGIVS
jgi:nicotinamide mononucleotide (NMN) deamidase PncC